MVKYPDIPDARDGLTHTQRVILTCLHQAQKELGDHRGVPSFLLYGRVVEQLDISISEMQAMLKELVGDREPD